MRNWRDDNLEEDLSVEVTPRPDDFVSDYEISA